jgi:hypothetical protein
MASYSVMEGFLLERSARGHRSPSQRNTGQGRKEVCFALSFPRWRWLMAHEMVWISLAAGEKGLGILLSCRLEAETQKAHFCA